MLGWRGACVALGSPVLHGAVGQETVSFAEKFTVSVLYFKKKCVAGLFDPPTNVATILQSCAPFRGAEASDDGIPSHPKFQMRSKLRGPTVSPATTTGSPKARSSTQTAQSYSVLVSRPWESSVLRSTSSTSWRHRAKPRTYVPMREVQHQRDL